MGWIFRAIIIATIFFFVQRYLRKLLDGSDLLMSKKAAGPKKTEKQTMMVACGACGIYLPKPRAVKIIDRRGKGENYYCAECAAEKSNLRDV